MPDGIWMEGGSVAERTNRVINVLVEEMNKQGNYQASTDAINTVIRKVAGVDTDETLAEYRKRIAKHGPFVVQMGRFHLANDYREGGDE